MPVEDPWTPQLDKRSLRALAHPLRMRLLSLLRDDGPATATGLASRVGESSGTTSWHLRQLADAGLVEDDPSRGNKRERWWRSVHETTNMRTADFIHDPELAGPLNIYLQSSAEQRYQREVQFVSELPRWIDDWQDKAIFSDGQLSLTPDEARELSLEVNALVARYRRDARPDDSSVVFHWAAFPRRNNAPESGEQTP